MPKHRRQALLRIFTLLFFVFLSTEIAVAAESSTKPESADTGSQVVSDDPYRPINIRVYELNDTFDHLLIKPLGLVYQHVTPSPLRRGVTNFFSNLGEPRVIFNDLLQGKGRQAVSDFARFGVNSTFGVGGLFDIAGPWGLPRHNEDFGQTLGAWGWKKSNYVVLPILGSSNVRDSIGTAVDFVTYPLFWYPDVATRNWLYLLQLANHRANLLDAEAVLEQAAGESERYDFVREAYIQHRRNVIYNGNPPLDLPYLPDNESPVPAKKHKK
jgi:phospholipid-binding lipoprotein MlaA